MPAFEQPIPFVSAGFRHLGDRVFPSGVCDFVVHHHHIIIMLNKGDDGGENHHDGDNDNDDDE